MTLYEKREIVNGSIIRVKKSGINSSKATRTSLYESYGLTTLGSM